eukprot:TRINITY_DN27425_c0_g1_i1.p1 TRINITY_DN27425_c0_g1~~TRINITY_DN27425_c0_g1_i1.p1  ORF type:complete len:462 (-),score=65.18 TRINITY_DN27425_c0_g1_i1:234-1619(-)
MLWFCEALAGLGNGNKIRLWFLVQVAAWAYLAAVNMHSALRWMAHFGFYDIHHEHRFRWTALAGCLKSLGFMMMNLAAMKGLTEARRMHSNLERQDKVSLKSGGSQRQSLHVAASLLVVLGIGLAIMEALVWSRRLCSLRQRQLATFNFTALTGICVIITRPGLVCGLVPDLRYRDEAAQALERLSQDVREANSMADWSQVMVKFGTVEEQVKVLGQQADLILLVSTGLCALMHGLSVWVWKGDSVYIVGQFSILVGWATGAMYGVVFLATYFMFAGVTSLHGSLVDTVAKQLKRCKGDEVWNVLQAYHYMQHRKISWRMKWLFGIGCHSDVDQVKGKVMSGAFLSNLVAKQVMPKLKEHSVRLGAAFASRCAATSEPCEGSYASWRAGATSASNQRSSSETVPQIGCNLRGSSSPGLVVLATLPQLALHLPLLLTALILFRVMLRKSLESAPLACRISVH